MQECSEAAISLQAGLEGDSKGRFQGRQVTILFAEDWAAATQALAVELPWTTRRANLLVAGMPNPRSDHGLLQIGAAVLAITGQTHPCARMDEAAPGLLKALAQHWRGGLTANVHAPGAIRVGDEVSWVGDAPQPRPVRILPG